MGQSMSKIASLNPDRVERTITLDDPATGKPCRELVFSTPDQIDAAVERARNAFDDGTAALSWQDRISLLEKLLRAVEAHREDFAQVISKQIGSPIDFTQDQQVSTAIGHIRATIDAAQSASDDDTIVDEDPNHRIRYEPIGVAALITPWNWPLNQVVLKVAAAFMAGCTIVLKPSELASDAAILFDTCIKTLNLPDGIFNLVLGDHHAGAQLVNHPDVDIISFTGSTEVGRTISMKAAEQFKRVILELGGKSPNILFADCDLERAMTQGIAHCFRNAGQSCNAASWMLIERSIYDEAVTLARSKASNFPVDLPHKSGNHIGPLVSQQQFERVQSYIQAGIDEGARLITGGLGKPHHLPEGWFAKPTVFADATLNMRITKEEIFGPVLTLVPFESEKEAIHLANTSDYGLAGYIQTADMERADRVARALRVGMVQVNGSSRAAGTAFGGRKKSGQGREAGIWGIRAFQEIKSISGTSLHGNQI